MTKGLYLVCMVDNLGGLWVRIPYKTREGAIRVVNKRRYGCWVVIECPSLEVIHNPCEIEVKVPAKCH